MSVNLGTATGFLDLDLSKFKKGMAEAGKQAQELPKQIKGSMGSVGETFREVGGKIADFGQGMTTMITLPVAAAVSASIKQFADFEQAIGGIETMFKDNADAVISNSETAYKRAGVSGVEYMEQLTSFSASLLQGLGGDTEKAGKLADMAMVDMSDNANKFGTNIGSVQDAYQGFAKQNYTMLDNLKLGYGGTASEMARLINDSGVMGDSFVATAKNMDEVPFDKMIEGIHQIQEGMGVTGTTLLEAEETISGSFGMMKASLMDFLAGMGSADADVEQLIQNMIDSFGYLKDNIIRVLKQIWDNLPLSNFQKWAGLIVAAAGPIIMVVGKIMTGVGSLIGTFVTAEGVMTPFGAMMKGLVSGPFLAVVAGIAILVAAFVDLWKNNEEFRNKIKDIWLNIQTSFEDFTYQLKEKLAALGINFESFGDALKAVWDKITEFLAPVFIFAFETIETIIDTVLETILDVFDLFVAIFHGDWETAWNKVVDIVFNMLQGVESIFENGLKLVYDIVQGAFKKVATFIIKWISNLTKDFDNGFKGIVAPVTAIMSEIWNIISNIFNYIKETFTNATAFIKAIVSGDFAVAKDMVREQMILMKETLSKIWESIKAIFSNWLKIIGTVLSEAWTHIKAKLSEVWDGIKAYFSEVWDGIKAKLSETWDGIKAYFSEMWEGIKTNFREAIDAIAEWFGSLPEKIGTALTNAWEKISAWATDLAGKAIEVGKNFVDSITKFFNELPENIGYVLGFVLGSIAKFGIDTWNKATEIGSKFLENIVSFFTQLPGKVKSFTDRVWDDIKTWASNIWTKATELGTKFINNIVTFFTQLPGKILSFINLAWGHIKTWASNMWNKATELGTKFINNIVTFFTQLPGKVLSFINQVINNVKTWVSNMGSQASQAGSRFVTNVSTTIQSLPGKVKAKLTEVVNSAKTWVTNMGTKGKEAIANLWNRFKNGFEGIKGSITAIGRNIVNGVWNGIKNAASNFTKNVKNFFGGIVSGAKAALGIKSPSQVMEREIGEPMAEGAEVGFLGMFGQVVKSIQNTIDDGVDSLTTPTVEMDVVDDTKGFARTIDASAVDMFDGILTIFETIENKIVASIDRTVSELRMLTKQVNGQMDYSIVYQTASSASIPIPIQSIQSGSSPSHIESGYDRKEFITIARELKDEVAKIKDMTIETIVNLDNREIARAQRDPIDQELASKKEDENMWKGRSN